MSFLFLGFGPIPRHKSAPVKVSTTPSPNDDSKETSKEEQESNADSSHKIKKGDKSKAEAAEAQPVEDGDEDKPEEDQSHSQRRSRRSVSFSSSLALLDRIESPDVSFNVMWSGSPGFGGNELNLEDGDVNLVAFYVLASKDQGGTLVFNAVFNSSIVVSCCNPSTESIS